MSTAIVTREVWHGLACTRIALANGDSIRVADFGAQVLSWHAQGHERLFLSELAVLDGSAAIRGGVPVCFPQFNQRGPLPKHGLARRVAWQWQPEALRIDAATDSVIACWQWDTPQALHADFPHALQAQLTVTLSPARLQVELAATNTGDRAFAFTGALHTYLAVQGADVALLNGLDQMAYWDAANGFAPAVQHGNVALGAEIDRVYARPPKVLTLQDAHGALQITQDAAWPETVVWNPGPALCASLTDMQLTDWMRMLCVEAAAINQPVALRPAQVWSAGQTLQILQIL